MNKYLVIYLLIINMASFVFFYIDKQKAIKDRWRVKESTLHILGFMGGILGSLLAMTVFHHKTKKPKFLIITFLALAFNALVAYEYLNYIFDGGMSIIFK